MQIKINGETIKLDPTEVKIAKQEIGKVLTSVSETSELLHCPSYFFTYLIVMNAISQETLSLIEPAQLKLIMNSIFESKYQKKPQKKDPL